MDERWQEIERIYHAALELDGKARVEFLAIACAGDDDLRREVESLLAHADQVGSFLEAPPVEMVAKAFGKDEHLPDAADATLETGSMVAHYRLTAKLGAGGMGEVYRARDTKLQRDVALKILPEAMARDAQRMARFEREARTLASLNHPNIAAIYGLEESNGVRALVMELVEGETLAGLLSVASGFSPAAAGQKAGVTTGGQRPPVQPDEALPIARQIAEALEYAHERGIIHRDLKPANVKITPEGTVKVLDFGLAKVLGPQDSSAIMNHANSSAVTTLLTQPGMILGTPSYMSPEQAKGQSVDRRCDIWAFGCVLYEMLTGRKTFDGEAISDVLAAVLTKEPDWKVLPATTPFSIRKLVHRCLQKDLRQRLQAIGDARIAIEETLGGTSTVAPDFSPADADMKVGDTWPEAEASAIRFSVFPPENTIFHTLGGFIRLSPDGRQLAFVSVGKDGKQLLWIRSLDELEAKSLPGTEGAEWPFWSPDSRQLGFYADGKLKKVRVSGGPVQTLSDASAGGGTWNLDGVIVFTNRHVLYRISEAGGTPSVVVKPDTVRQELAYFPQCLPDGRHFLFGVVGSDLQDGATRVGSLGSEEQKTLLSGDSTALFAHPGYLLYLQDGVLMARRFDVTRLEFTAKPDSVAEDVGSNSLYPLSYFSVSANGVLAYRPRAISPANQMIWLNRRGGRLGSVGEAGVYSNPAISPDGARVAFGFLDSRTRKRDIWVYDLRRGTGSPLTFDPANTLDPVWSPNGKQIMFTSEHHGVRGIYQKSSDGLGNAELTFADKVHVWNIDDVSPDGRYALYEDTAPRTNLWALPLFGQRKAFAYLQGEFQAYGARFAPKGQYVAYTSEETGRPEVFVQTFPERHRKWQISPSGGTEPMWRRDGKELFYLKPDGTVMSVHVKTRAREFRSSVPRPLFQVKAIPGKWKNRYAISPDGQRFLMIVPAEQEMSAPITVVLNWPALLKK